MVVITRDTAIDKTINHIRDILRNNIIDTQGTLEFSQNVSDTIIDTSPLTTPWTDDMTGYKTKYTFRSDGDAIFQLYNEDGMKKEKEVVNTDFSFIVTYNKKHRVMVATDSTIPVSIEIIINSYSDMRAADKWIFDGMPNELVEDPYNIKTEDFPLIEINYTRLSTTQLNTNPGNPLYNGMRVPMEIIIFALNNASRKNLCDQVKNILLNYNSADLDDDTLKSNKLRLAGDFEITQEASYWSVPKIRRGFRILASFIYGES